MVAASAAKVSPVAGPMVTVTPLPVGVVDRVNVVLPLVAMT